MKKSISAAPMRALLIVIITLISAMSASAIEHAAFHRALPDLRSARWLIIHQPGESHQTSAQQQAIIAIEYAIKAINKSNISDEKPMDDHTVDDSGEKTARLQRAIDLLRKVRGDIKRNEDTTFGNNLQEAVIIQIDKAIEQIKRMMEGK